jgi:hypothetical protein
MGTWGIRLRYWEGPLCKSGTSKQKKEHVPKYMSVEWLRRNIMYVSIPSAIIVDAVVSVVEAEHLAHWSDSDRGRGTMKGDESGRMTEMLGRIGTFDNAQSGSSEQLVQC